ncbi:Phosphopantetheine adenylyltransferase [Frankia sp. EI5c]|uniref:pantetheine-phosphate adenylyltransferase n=1 Tax=Frankia sp. EI5c TaxID=683316 RepID=UPI0007C28F44|nr:pantetheine-phosphate adenylyltransferase [Frankia sp. EI5c]OAA22317.1 Phosphopantetheine adenylyltransferase [Frankia sp. EI5c]
MRRAACPGSFDPITNGHLDIIVRASRLFDEVVVAVSINKNKATLFTVEERMELVRQAVRDHPQAPSNVLVDSSHGLIVDFCRAKGAQSIVKGLRAVSDFDYELQMAQMNNSLAGVETFFMSTNPQYAFLSSSLVKEVARYGGDVSGLVPDGVLKRLRERLAD